MKEPHPIDMAHRAIVAAMTPGSVAFGACGRLDFNAQADASPDAEVEITQLALEFSPTFVNAPDLAVPIELTAGASVVVAVTWNDAASVISLTADTIAEFIALPAQSIASGCNPPAGGTDTQMFFAMTPTTASDTIIVHQSRGSAPLSAIVVAYAGIAAPTSSIGAISQAPSNAMDVGAIDIAKRGLVLAMFTDSDGGGLMTAGGGFTGIHFDRTSYAVLEGATAMEHTLEITAALPSGRSDACWVGTAALFPAR